MFNSTIRIKQGKCTFPGCHYYGPLTKGMCGNHYWLGVRMKSAEKFTEKEIKEEGIQDLIADLDILVSKWVRYSAVDKDGLVQCYTCPVKLPPSGLDAGHYITRKCLYLRFDVSRNIRPQCVSCNRVNYGMSASFGKNLENELPGVTEILLEESRIVFKYSREELRSLIAEFTNKIKLLKK